MADDKSEEATPRRLQKAQEEGDSGISSELGKALAFLTTLAIAPAAFAVLADTASSDLRAAISSAATTHPQASFDAAHVALSVAKCALPILLAAGAVAAVASFVQSGGVVATKKLTPNLDRLNIFQGIKNLFSAHRAFSVARSLATAALVAYLAWRAFASHAADLANLAGRTSYVGLLAKEITYGVARKVAAVMLALAILDLVITRRSWKKKLRMSKEEIKREHKESEGDPQTKSARERARHEMLAAAAVGNVRTASVVVINPTHLACALRYDEKEGDEAPVVVASGEGELAERIVKAARDYGVPVLRDIPLAHALIELEIGDQIPEALYEAVAEILREVWEDDEKTGT